MKIDEAECYRSAIQTCTRKSSRIIRKSNSPINSETAPVDNGLRPVGRRARLEATIAMNEEFIGQFDDSHVSGTHNYGYIFGKFL